MSSLRTLQLLALSIAGGAVLGGLAGMGFLPPTGLVIGAIFGLVIGFISFAIVGPALAEKSLTATAAPTYVPPAIVALVSGPFGPDVAIPASGAALALSALVVHCAARNAFPHPHHQHCRKCGYDISAAASDRCPECGTKIGPRRPGRRWALPVVAWLSVVLIGLLAVTGATVPPALERATLGHGTTDPQRLMELMGDPDTSTAYNAAKRLREINPNLLLEALEHPDPGTRREAARTLRFGFEENPETFAALIEALDDPDARVRVEAIVSLGHIRNPEALTPLQELAERDPSPMVARTARETIALIRSENENREESR